MGWDIVLETRFTRLKKMKLKIQKYTPLIINLIEKEIPS